MIRDILLVCGGGAYGGVSGGYITLVFADELKAIGRWLLRRPARPAPEPYTPPPGHALDYTPPGWARDHRGILVEEPRAHTPRHASTARVNAGGSVREQVVPRKRTADLPPWDVRTAAQPVYGEKPVVAVLSAERLAQMMTP
jgi:hypothetical protein